MQCIHPFAKCNGISLKVPLNRRLCISSELPLNRRCIKAMLKFVEIKVLRKSSFITLEIHRKVLSTPKMLLRMVCTEKRKFLSLDLKLVKDEKFMQRCLKQFTATANNFYSTAICSFFFLPWLTANSQQTTIQTEKNTLRMKKS